MVFKMFYVLKSECFVHTRQLPTWKKGRKRDNQRSSGSELATVCEHFLSLCSCRLRLNKRSMLMSNSNHDCHLYSIWCCSFIVQHNKQCMYVCSLLSVFRSLWLVLLERKNGKEKSQMPYIVAKPCHISGNVLLSDSMNCCVFVRGWDVLEHLRSAPFENFTSLGRIHCTLPLSKNSCFCLIFITWFMVYLILSSPFWLA